MRRLRKNKGNPKKQECPICKGKFTGGEGRVVWKRNGKKGKIEGSWLFEDGDHENHVTDEICPDCAQEACGVCGITDPKPSHVCTKCGFRVHNQIWKCARELQTDGAEQEWVCAETSEDFNDPNRIVVVALEDIPGTPDEPVELWVQYNCGEVGSDGRIVTVPVIATSGLIFVPFLFLFLFFLFFFWGGGGGGGGVNKMGVG
jgi:hypothetical protein